MGMKKIKAEITSMTNTAYSDGYDQGFDSGEEQGYAVGYEEGIQAERERIETMIKMQLTWAMGEGKGTQIVFWKNALEILIDMPKQIANALQESELREELKDYGF